MFGVSFAAMACAWLVSTMLATIAICRRFVQQHHEWMIRSYVVTFGFVTFRILVFAFDVTKTGTMVERMTAASWLSWSVPLLVTIVLIKKGHTKPLFLFHPIAGGLGCYDELTALLREDITVYGIHGMATALADATTINELAVGYVAQIQALDNKGPYRLLGYSFGTLLATEVARRLETGHGAVDLLAFMDTPPRLTELPDDPDFLWRDFIFAIGLEPDKLAAEHPDLFHANNRDNCAVLVPFLKRRTASAQFLESIYKRFRRNCAAGRTYRYEPHRGLVVLYNAVRGTGNLTLFNEYWQAREIVDLDADHDSIVTGTAIRQIANHLNELSWT